MIVDQKKYEQKRTKKNNFLQFQLARSLSLVKYESQKEKIVQFYEICYIKIERALK